MQSLQEVLATGVKLCQAKRFVEAEQLYRAAAERFPNDFPLLNNLAVVLAMQGKPEEAMPWHDRAAEAPDYLDAHANRGETLVALERFAEAAKSFERVVQLSPQSVDAVSKLGNCHRRTNRDKEAAECFRRAIELNPDRAIDRALLGQTLWNLGEQTESLAHLRRAVELEPAGASYRYAYGMSLLLHGELPRGWEEAEFRLQTEELRAVRASVLGPIWDGSPLNGRTIYLQSEQGIGDTLQFIRYAPMVAQRGGVVFAGTHLTLQRLIAGVQGITQALAPGEAMPRYACWAPLLSLPQIFRTDLHDIPAHVPYLRADPARLAQWKTRLADSRGLRVGLAWAGNPGHSRDHLRSMRLEQFAPLAAVSNVTWFSLQKGAGAEQVKSPPTELTLIDLAPELNDFDDTAAVIENLDLVISVDTAVVHLAGALGKKVWTLLHYSPDWRWMLDREDTPWYPTMRLFRQKTYGDWADVIERVRTAIDRREV